MKLKDIIVKPYPFSEEWGFDFDTSGFDKEKLQRAVDEIEERHKTLEALMSKEITIQAIRDSIEHWERDILKPLKQGNEIKRVSKDITLQERSIVLHWIPSGEKVKCYSDSCALCKVFYGKLQPCEGCPLYEAGFACVEPNSPYIKFYHNPCLDTAQNMVLVLGNLLIDALEEKRRIELDNEPFPKHEPEKQIKLKAGQVYNYNGDYWLLIARNDTWQMIRLDDYSVSGSFGGAWLSSDTMRDIIDNYFTLIPNAKIKVIDGK